MGQAFRVPKRTILCIDDDHAILAYQRALLEGLGYEVLAASSAYHGIALATLCALDAVVLDYHMPELNGHHVAVAIKQCQPGISIVMFSGGDVPEETRNLVDAVVLKTDAIEHLLTTIALVCNRSSAERRELS
jgi:CheY-like chemotaxis protein